jgi:F0F1-type ATP synthase assembly protein I
VGLLDKNSGDPSKKKKDRTYAQIALLGSVPGILVAAPLIGFFAGQWADGRFKTAPYLTILGIVLGFIAAGREIYRLVKRAQDMEKDDDPN